MRTFTQLLTRSLKTPACSFVPRFAFGYYSNINLKASNGKTFYAKDLTIEKSTNLKQLPEWDNNVKFGQHSSDHMLTIDWDEKTGWQKPKIVPFANFSIHPFNSTLHYALEVFEGTKAFYNGKDGVQLFRLEANMWRMKNSVAKMSLPDFDGEEFAKCIEELIRLDQRWVPRKEGFSLYVRPTAISMDTKLGVAAPQASRLFCVLSPVGPYFPEGFKPVSLYCDSERYRAAPFGTGAYKIGGNYAPTIAVSKKAQELGYQQVLWLWNDEVNEVGTSNIFFLWINENGEKELVTPWLTDECILPGVTRDSVLTLTRRRNEYKVTERCILMKEVIKAIEENRLIEAFGAGTAVTVCPIERINYKGKDYKIPIDKRYNAGEESIKILKEIQDIQTGKTQFSNWGKSL